MSSSSEDELPPPRKKIAQANPLKPPSLETVQLRATNQTPPSADSPENSFTKNDDSAADTPEVSFHL